MEQKSILVMFFYFISLNLFSQNNLPQKKTNCLLCKGSGVVRTMVICNNCKDWNLEYRSKRRCDVCKDTRQVFGQKVKCPSIFSGGCGGKGYFIVNNIPEKLSRVYFDLFLVGGRTNSGTSETRKFWSSAKLSLSNSNVIRFEFDDLYFDFDDNDNIEIVNKKNNKKLKGLYDSSGGYCVIKIGEERYLLYQMESDNYFGLEKLLIDASN